MGDFPRILHSSIEYRLLVPTNVVLKLRKTLPSGAPMQERWDIAGTLRDGYDFDGR
jgi:hypothetical protein